MHPAVRKTDFGAQKINGSTLETFGMAIADFLLQDKLGKVVLEMPFLTLSSADIRFAERELVWRTYTAAEALADGQADGTLQCEGICGGGPRGR